jgi:hypothetical protein
MLVTGETLGFGLSNGTGINLLRIYFHMSLVHCWSVFLYLQIGPTVGGGFPGQQVLSQSNHVIAF